MELKRLIFPAESRHFPGQRWVNITLRTIHLVGIAGLGGGFFYTSPEDHWQAFFELTLWSGAGLTTIAVWSNGVWLIQLRGQAIVLKLLLLALMPLLPAMRVPLLLAILVVSGVISHAPASVRYFSLWHGRRIDRG